MAQPQRLVPATRALLVVVNDLRCHLARALPASAGSGGFRAAVLARECRQWRVCTLS